MANNRQELVKDFTDLVLSSIASEESEKTKPRKPVLVTLSVRMPVKLKHRLERAVKRRGVQQTQLIKHALIPMLGVILEDDFSGMQMDLNGE